MPTVPAGLISKLTNEVLDVIVNYFFYNFIYLIDYKHIKSHIKIKQGRDNQIMRKAQISEVQIDEEEMKDLGDARIEGSPRQSDEKMDPLASVTFVFESDEGSLGVTLTSLNSTSISNSDKVLDVTSLTAPERSSNRLTCVSTRFGRPGVLALILGACAFSLQLMAAKKTSGHFAPYQTVYIQMFLSLVFSSVFLIQQKRVPLPKVEVLTSPGFFLVLAGRGILRSLGLGFLYTSLRQLNIAEAAVLYNSLLFIFVAAMERIISGKRISIVKVAAFIIVFISTLMISTDGDWHLLPFVEPTGKGVMYGAVMMAAFAEAILTMIDKTVTAAIDPVSLCWWNGLSGCTLLNIPTFFMPTYVPRDNVLWEPWLYLILVAFCAFAAQLSQWYGIKREAASLVTIILNCDAIFAMVWEVIIFHTPIGAIGWIGGGCYLAAVGLLVRDD